MFNNLKINIPTNLEGLIVAVVVAVSQVLVHMAENNGTINITWQTLVVAAAAGVIDWQTSHYWKHQPAPEPLPGNVLPPSGNGGPS